MLLKASLTIKLASRTRTSSPPRYDVARLQDKAVAEQFRLELSNRFDTLPTDDDNGPSIEEEWRMIRDTIKDASEKVLGRKKRKRKKWISEDTIKLSNQKQQIGDTKSTAFKTLRKECHKSARRDRQRYWDHVATDMQKAASHSDTRKLYQLLQEATGKSKKISSGVRAEDGTLLSRKDDIIARWQRHFQKLLNPSHDIPPTQTPSNNGATSPQPSNPNPSSVPPSQPTPYSNVNVDPPSIQEIKVAIKKLRNHKAPGIDSIPAEVYKTAPILAEKLHKLFCSIWSQERFPQEWQDSVIIPVFKKGDRTECKNFRGISLISIAGKIFAMILLNRFRTVRNERIRPNQSGFRAGMGCIDQLFTLRQIFEHRAKHQQITVAVFIDFITAFDSVIRGGIWKAMEEDGVPPKIIRLIQAYYQHTRACLQANGELSPLFDIDFGVRQGCVLSPELFNFVVDWILEKAMLNFEGVKVSPDFSISDLDYADDVALLGESAVEAQDMLLKVSEVAAQMGLKVNIDKTKAMSNAPDFNSTPITLNQRQIEVVNKFKYLGSYIDINGGCSEEIQCRIASASAVFAQLRKPLWKRLEIHRRTKIRIYDALVRSVLLYGCETWPLKAAEANALNTFDHRCLRSILGIRLSDRVPNTVIYQRCNQKYDIATLIRRRRLSWFGHVCRRPTVSFTNQSLRCKPAPDWRKRQGGQVKTWLNTVKSDLEPIGGFRRHGRRWDPSWLEIVAPLTQDRNLWNSTVCQILSPGRAT